MERMRRFDRYSSTLLAFLNNSFLDLYDNDTRGDIVNLQAVRRSRNGSRVQKPQQRPRSRELKSPGKIL